jgi:hypothetical protein
VVEYRNNVEPADTTKSLFRYCLVGNLEADMLVRDCSFQGVGGVGKASHYIRMYTPLTIDAY